MLPNDLSTGVEEEDLSLFTTGMTFTLAEINTVTFQLHSIHSEAQQMYSDSDYPT